MSSLTPSEKKILRSYLKMDLGVVLDFTNHTFKELFSDLLNVNIYDDKYAIHGDSKAKRLAAFWEIESDEHVAKVLHEMKNIEEINGDDGNGVLRKKTEAIIQRIIIKPFSGAAYNAEHVYEKDKIKVFISHRDAKKRQAKALAQQLQGYGISCFVAHDTIVPMTQWKHEILKGLGAMDAFLLFLTDDCWESVWVNQEVGYALAKEIPFYIYSADGTDPRGFWDHYQAIKTGEDALFELIKRDFSQHQAFKEALLERFIAAKESSFAHAKDMFVQIAGLSFNDETIEKIVKAVTGSTKHSINQLGILLIDLVEERHKQQLGLSTPDYYANLLEVRVLAQHSKKRYSVRYDQDSARWCIVDSEQTR